MSEEESQQISHGITRREANKTIASGLTVGFATLASAEAVELAMKLGPKKSHEINNQEEIQRKLANKFNVQEATVDIMTDGHRVSVPEDAGQTVLMGEIDFTRLSTSKESIEQMTFGQHQNVGGIEISTKQSMMENAIAMEQFSIVFSTDSANGNILLEYLTDERLKNTITKVGINATGALVAGILQYQKGPRFETPPTQKEAQLPSRRDFLKFFGVGAAAVATGAVLAKAGNEVVKDDGRVELDLNRIADPFERELYSIYNPYEKDLVESRNDVMAVNMNSVSAINLPDSITKAQVSMASSHEPAIRQATEDDQTQAEIRLANRITEVVNHNLELLKKYPGDDEKKGKIIASQARFFEQFNPVMMRLNIYKVPGETTRRIKANTYEQKSKSAHLILFETLANIEANSQLDEQSVSTLRASLTLYKDATDHHFKYNGSNSEFALDLAGDQNNIDQTIRAFGQTAGFSKGLTARI